MLQLLDHNGKEYENRAGGFFTGGKYTVAAENDGELTVKGKSGNIMRLDVTGESSGTVTGTYAIEIMENDGVGYLRVKQYIAGEFMTDHIGDVVGVYGLEGETLTLLEEITMACG